jgi:hypothetical protein
MKSPLSSVLLLSVASLSTVVGCAAKSPNDSKEVAPSVDPGSDVAPGESGTGATRNTSSSAEPSSTETASPQTDSEQTSSSAPHVTSAPGATADGDSLASGTSTGSEAGGSSSTVPTVDSSGSTDASNTNASVVGFSVPSCTFEGSLIVTIAGAVNGAELRYTTDGTLPTASSTLYEGAELTLTETTQLRAQQFLAGTPSGFGATALYIRRTFDVSSDISLIIMEGYGGGKPPTESGPQKVVYHDLGFMLFEPVDGVAAISAAPTWASRAGYHVRGQSSASFEKTPYRLELWDENDADMDRPMIGMPADSDWAMIGEYSDKTLTRNAFSFSLATDMGLQAPEMRFAEVYINQDQGPLEEADYQGVYLITETIKNNPDRLDLAQLKPTDTEEAKLSGGYIFKFDLAALREDEGEIEILCTGNEDTCFDDLELTDPPDPNAEQLAWIGGYVSQAHAALVAEPIGDYAQYLDVDSFVNMLVLNELTKGGDKYVRSVYLFKDRDGLINAGPAWDYNFTLGNLVNDVEGWQVDGGRDYGVNWFQRLFAQPEIKALMAARWAELRQNILSDGELEARIDRVAVPIANAGPRDLARWPLTEGGVFGGGLGGMDDDAPVDGTPLTWQGHIDEMKSWIRTRTAWLDAEYATF